MGEVRMTSLRGSHRCSTNKNLQLISRTIAIEVRNVHPVI
jgi:hypothetical protein